MSVYRFSEWGAWGTKAWRNAACAYCGHAFEEADDIHVEWRCAGHTFTAQGFTPGFTTLFLHGGCAKEWAIHLASDSLKASHKRVDSGPDLG